MYNTFDLQIDDELESSSPTRLKGNLNDKIQNNFMSGTITKNFFANKYQEDQSDYMVPSSSSKMSPVSQKKQADKKIKEDPSARRERKQQMKLAPIQQSSKVEVFQNYVKNDAVEEIEDQVESFDSPTKETMEITDADIKRRTQRRRTSKKEPAEEIKVEQEKERKEEEETIKLPPKPTQFFFNDQPEEEIAKKQENEHIPIPQTKINNNFASSDDEAIEVTQQVQNSQNVITGSQYFNFANEEVFTKQLHLDIREKTTLRMEIIRDKGGFNTFWPQFHLHFSEDTRHVMSAKKTSSRPTSTFIISKSKDDFSEEGPFYLGKMKSNVLGDVLNIFGHGLNPSNAKQKNVRPRELLATVVFMTSLFQMGKPRQFLVYIKDPSISYYDCFQQVKMYQQEIPLNTLYGFLQNKPRIRVMHNRQPVWVNEIGGYMLNFRGRVEKPSIKNFIMEEISNGPDVIVFGKVNENKFNFDVSSRISTYIAFAVALSSFDSRLMCE